MKSNRRVAGLAALLLPAASLTALFLAGAAPVAAQETTEPEGPYLIDDDRAGDRLEMVERYLAPEIADERVLDAMRRVPRHRFIPDEYTKSAYYNRPLPIGEGQTISQPIVVAKMTELLRLEPDSRVLEIGTGSGYQAAILAELAGEVYSIEIVEALGVRAAETLAALGYDGLNLRIGDGYQGWPEAAPFDAIIVTCAPEAIPEPLQEQLAEGGRLVIPVGERGLQELVLVEKEDGRLNASDVIPVRFVPMVDATGRTYDR